MTVSTVARRYQIQEGDRLRIYAKSGLVRTLTAFVTIRGAANLLSVSISTTADYVEQISTSKEASKNVGEITDMYVITSQGALVFGQCYCRVQVLDSQGNVKYVLARGYQYDESPLGLGDEDDDPTTNAASIPDGFQYRALLSHSRSLQVNDRDWWMYEPAGRVLWKDDFEHAGVSMTSASSGAGTVTSLATPYAHSGRYGLNILTPAAVAGWTQAEKFVPYPADDLGRTDGAKLWMSTMYSFDTASEPNIREIALRLTIWDGQRQWKAELEFEKYFNSAVQDFVRVVTTGGGVQNITLTGPTQHYLSQGLHRLGMEVQFRRNTSTQYKRVRVDDEVEAAPISVDAQNVGATTETKASLAVIVTNDDAATSVNLVIDDIWISDLNQVKGIVG